MARAKTSRGSWSQRGPDGEEFGGGVGFVLVMRFVAANSHNELTPGTILALDRDLPHSVEGLEESVVLLKLHLAEPQRRIAAFDLCRFLDCAFPSKVGQDVSAEEFHASQNFAMVQTRETRPAY